MGSKKLNVCRVRLNFILDKLQNTDEYNQAMQYFLKKKYGISCQSTEISISFDENSSEVRVQYLNSSVGVFKSIHDFLKATNWDNLTNIQKDKISFYKIETTNKSKTKGVTLWL